MAYECLHYLFLNFSLHVLLGEYDRKTNPDCVQTLDGQSCAPSSQLIRVEERIMHPAWVKSEPQIYNDIALLRMAERPKFNGDTSYIFEIAKIIFLYLQITLNQFVCQETILICRMQSSRYPVGAKRKTVINKIF